MARFDIFIEKQYINYVQISRAFALVEITFARLLIERKSGGDIQKKPSSSRLIAWPQLMAL